jgi:Icc-related predicted phosphoesterase
MKLLAFSDLHCDLDRAAQLVQRSSEADVVIGAGDFASVHRGLEETIEALSGIDKPTFLVPGNNETEDALRTACKSWPAATVLHGEAGFWTPETADGDPQAVFGLGGGIPVTPWDWSFDLDEDAAAEQLAPCPEGIVLAVHSPPKGHCDVSGSGEHLGSTAILEAIESKQPVLAVCGHIHESWGAESSVGETPVVNLGPDGRMFEI